MKRKNLFSTILMIVLTIVGLALIFQPYISQHFAKSKTEQYKISNISSDQLEQNAKQSEKFLSQFSDNHSLKVTALVSIPDVNINLPVFNNDSDDAITYGASNVRKSKIGEGNYSLASHFVFSGSKNRLFTPLINAKKGTKVYVTDKSKIYTYEIYDIFDVDQYAVQVLDDIRDEKTITLITCADFKAEYRHIYRGKLINVQNYNESSEEVKSSFEKEFNL